MIQKMVRVIKKERICQSNQNKDENDISKHKFTWKMNVCKRKENSVSNEMAHILLFFFLNEMHDAATS